MERTDLSLPIKLRPSGTVPVLLRELQERRNAIEGLGSGSAAQILPAYLKWANETAQRLGRLVGPSELDTLVQTPRYWLLQHLDEQTPDVIRLVTTELDDRRAAIDDLVKRLTQFNDRWATAGQLLVADTNYFLYAPALFTQLNWHRAADLRTYDVFTLVVPIVVVDELDRCKRITEVKANARHTLKALQRLFGDNPGWPQRLADEDQHGKVALLIDPPTHVQLSKPDNEIIDRAAALGSLVGREVKLMTRDTGMAFRAHTEGLPVGLEARPDQVPKWTISTSPEITPP